jgi:carbon-monoxide dehydrogenase large subunit
MNAIVDALAPWRQHVDMPATPQAIWRIINQHQ